MDAFMFVNRRSEGQINTTVVYFSAMLLPEMVARLASYTRFCFFFTSLVLLLFIFRLSSLSFSSFIYFFFIEVVSSCTNESHLTLPWPFISLITQNKLLIEFTVFFLSIHCNIHIFTTIVLKLLKKVAHVLTMLIKIL